MESDEPAGRTGLGALLRRHRLAAGLTQEALAERAGLGTRTVQNLEEGRHRPHRETAERLAAALGLGGDQRAAFEAATRPTPRRPRAAPRAPGKRSGLRAVPTPRHNLPTPLTSFVGRGKEVARVRRLLATARLLTLTGTGGCGKTRLALRSVDGLVAGYPDGIWLVELAALADPALVPATIATVLGLRAQSGRPLLDLLREQLHDRRLLLLLDNCEHLVQACAQVAEALLLACAGLRILATSREPLGIPGEVAWRVPYMAAPSPDRLPPLEQVRRAEAVQLFAERAAAVDPTFAVTEANVRAVAQICWRLDGIPLALELAAARAKLLTAEHIAERLDERVPGAGHPIRPPDGYTAGEAGPSGGRFRLLTGGSRTAPPRQQTLRATLDWSHDLLTDPERRLFRRLAVFAGGFTLEAAEAVCAGDEIDESDVLDLLTRLVDKSLVQVEKREGVERYRLLETLRQYGRERLLEAAEEERLCDRHRDWFLGLAERAKPELIGPQQAAWLDRLEAERDNLRAALGRCLERGPADLGLRLAGALWRFWFVRDPCGEGREWLARVLAAPGADAPTPSRAEALDAAAELALYAGDYFAAAPRLAEESLAIRRASGDQRGVASALRQLAEFALYQGNAARADGLAEEALARARDAGTPRDIALALEILAGVAVQAGDYPLARRHVDEALAICRQLGDRRAIAARLRGLAMLTCQAGDYATARACWQEALTIAGDLRGKAQIAEIRAGLGILALLEGDHARSRALLEEGLALAQESAAWSLIGLVVFNLGRLARAEEDIARADALIRESLSVFRDHGDWTGVAAPLTWSGVIAVERGLLRRGVRLIGASASRQPRPWWESSHDRRAYDQRLSDARAALGEPGFAAAFAEGQTMTLDQAVAYALSDDDSVNSPPDEPRPVESIPPPATQSGGPWSAPEHPTAAR